MNDILKQIVEQWYLSEPALFHLYCMQQMVENTQMQCVVRCGKGRVEWNPTLTAQENINSTKLEELLRVEMIRLFFETPIRTATRRFATRIVEHFQQYGD